MTEPGQEFPDDFKETESGPIPVDWDVVWWGKEERWPKL